MEGKAEEFHNLSVLACVFLEQVALDNGKYQLAWVISGFNPPAFNLTQRNAMRTSGQPFALLADARWVAANLSYLRDLNYFQEPQRRGWGPSVPPVKASAEEDQGQEPRRRAPEEKRDPAPPTA